MAQVTIQPNKCTIEIFCKINPSEDFNKIKSTISNIFPKCKIKIKNSLLQAYSENTDSLKKIHESIHSMQHQRIYKRTLQKNLKKNSTWFYLNKQAAFVEKIAICEESNESPLGPIKIILTANNIDKIIDWLVFSK